MTIYILKIKNSAIDAKNFKFEFTNFPRAKKEAQKFRDKYCLIYKKDFPRCWNWRRFANEKNWYFEEETRFI